MPALILQNPRSRVQFDPPADPESVIRAQAATIAELQAVVTAKATPLHVQALKGELAPETCCACGCHIPLKPMQTSWPMGVLYGDPHLDVTRAISHALETSCGPAMEVLIETLAPEDLLMVARQLSRVAVSAHLSELAK